MISCEEAAVICSKSQYREASWLEKIQLKLHMLMCKACVVFSLRNSRLTALFRDADLQCLSDEDKAELKNKLQLYR